jgi:hypothetical protein
MPARAQVTGVEAVGIRTTGGSECLCATNGVARGNARIRTAAAIHAGYSRLIHDGSRAVTPAVA